MFYYADFAANVTFTDSSGARSSWAVTADTGSSNLAVTVESCSSCGSSTSTLTLDTVSSSTLEVKYGESDDITYWSGEYATSTVGFFGGNGYGKVSCDTDVGAITSQSGFFDDDEGDDWDGHTDTVFGIWGLAYPDLAESYSGGEPSTPFFNALWNAGQLESEAFALQICGTSAEYYGYLTLGGYARDHVDGTVAWLDLQKYYGSWTYYLVVFSSLAVGGIELDYSESILGGSTGAAVIDSGTTYIVLPEAVVGSTSESGTVLGDLYSGYTGSMNSENLERFLNGESGVPESDITGFPIMSITLDSKHILNLTISEMTLCYTESSSDVYCQFGVTSGSVTIIGNIAMAGKVLIFDQGANQLGIADGTNCGVLPTNLTGSDPPSRNDDDDAESSFNTNSPFYGKWWVWILMILAFCVLGAAMSSCCQIKSRQQRASELAVYHDGYAPLTSDRTHNPQSPPQSHVI